MSLDDYIRSGVNGGNILFCGAGFSADCLNFNDEELGTAFPLHSLLNDKLNYRFDDIQLSADEYIDKFGEAGLLSLLRDKYNVLRHTTEINDILEYPWERIYTTNYDDTISQSLKKLDVEHCVANNTETPRDVEKRARSKEKWVVHLHGALERWDINNFVHSCVLGRKSYFSINEKYKWADRFTEDCAKANAIFFVGFSNNDLYLMEKLHSASALCDKTFFINPKGSESDRNLIGRQKGFGQSFAIGKNSFAEKLNQARKNREKPEQKLYSFTKRILPDLPQDRASFEEQENFFIFGQTSLSLQFKDIFDKHHSYRFPRTKADSIVSFIKKNDSSVAHILGSICSGKTTLFEECIMLLLQSGETVFSLEGKYEDMCEELKKIASKESNVIIAIDDCYALQSRLGEILEEISSKGMCALLSSRTLARDSEEDLRNFITHETEYKSFDIDILDETECDSLIDCTDRIAGWEGDVLSLTEKKKILKKRHTSRLSSFLLGVFSSSHIRERFNSQLEDLRTSGKSVEEALVLALYLKIIVGNVEEKTLSRLLEKDSVALFKKASSSPVFLRYKNSTKTFDVLSSINARDALKHLFDADFVTRVIIRAVENIEHIRFQPAFEPIFKQFMRYTQLKHVVGSHEQQNLFFDRLSEMPFCRNHVLFWLQWSMAMRDHKKWSLAQQHLDEAYRLANKDQFGISHLDDQQALLLLVSISDTPKSGDFLNRTREVCSLLTRSIGKPPITSHNYQTIQSFKYFFEKVSPGLLEKSQVRIISGNLLKLKRTVETNEKKQGEGYIREQMSKAIATLDDALTVLERNGQ